MIYGIAGLAKLQGPSWWNGMALWGTMTAGEFVVLDFTALAAWPLLINLLTHASLTIELLYPVLIWVRIVRPLWLACVVAMHLGIAVISPGLTEFALAMLAGNLAFFSGAWLRGLATGPTQPAQKVLFDGACPRCRASMALITAADPDHVVEPIDLTAVDVTAIHPNLTRADCMQSMHVVSRSGRITAGFDGVRSVAASLPLFWPVAPILYLPGVAWLGRRVYNSLRPLGRATFPALTMSAGSTLERRRLCLATEAILKTNTTRLRLWQTPRSRSTHETNSSNWARDLVRFRRRRFRSAAPDVPPRARLAYRREDRQSPRILLHDGAR